MGIKFQNDKVVLSIDEGVILRLKSFRQCDRQMPESGGFLLGRTDINGNTRIFEITEPMEHDVAGRACFKRIDKGHLAILRDANSRCLYYKGNWHTHPQGSPMPSFVDNMSWMVSMRETKPGDSNYIFFLIVGTDELKVWCGDMKKRRLHELLCSEGKEDLFEI